MITIDGSDLQGDGRFSRFELISWWDQQRLAKARVLVIGAGALGNEIVKNCAMLGIGNVVVADMDKVENSNLSRSVLFREADNGSWKVDVVAKAAREIYPDMKIYPFRGNIVYDMGWGLYFWADVIIGGLDNREARVAINSGAAFAKKMWIDGAIEVLNGVARVFSAADGPCYECTMNETDWKILENRRSCALLTRDEMEQGRVPTTPTTGSIVAGVQVQESVKILHGMESLQGQGFVFSGLTGDSYLVRYPRKPDCFGHEACERIEKLDCGVSTITVGELLQKARNDLGADAVIGLHRDIITALLCPHCDSREPIYSSLGKITEKQGRCTCGQLRTPETLLTLGLDDNLNDKTLAQIGIPPLDVVTARCEETTLSYLFAGDMQKIFADGQQQISL